ncbi:MAG: TetR/AcrR family transcriptional regulator [Actinomycetota bacterium]
MDRRLTKRGSRRREQVMEVATRLFAEQGYHGTTVGDICDELGVGKGVFYWYLDSKEGLFQELLKSALYRLRRAQQSAIEDVEDPVERIQRGIRASIEYFRGQPAILALLRTAARYEKFANDLNRGQEVVVADTALHIKAGMADGLIRHGDPELMAHGILGAILHFVETYFGTEAGAVEDRPQLAEEAVAFCLRGVLSDQARRR